MLPTTQAARAENRQAATHMNNRAIRAAERGDKGKLPDELPVAFVRDVAEWGRVLPGSQYGWMGDRSFIEYQEDLAAHWPHDWIVWLFASVGFIKYTDAI